MAKRGHNRKWFAKIFLNSFCLGWAFNNDELHLKENNTGISLNMSNAVEISQANIIFSAYIFGRALELKNGQQAS